MATKKKTPIPGRQRPDKPPEFAGRLKIAKEELRFYHGDYQSDSLANNLGQFIEIYHIPSNTSVAFKGAITNFQDNYSQQWNPTEVFGRMDPIANYVRTRRTVQVGVDIMAASFQEAYVNMSRMSLLEQMQYPVMEGNVNNGSSHMQGGPLIKVKFMNWISNSNGEGTAKSKGLMGWMDGIQFSPKLDLGVFQDGPNVYPKGFEISFTLNVIHEETIGWRVGADVVGEGADTNFNNSMYPYGVDSILGEEGQEATEATDEQIATLLGESPPETQEAVAEQITGGGSSGTGRNPDISTID
jgi:hypothetical protein